MSSEITVTVQPVVTNVVVTTSVVIPAASATLVGGVQLAGDLGGTATAPLVEKIQATVISPPPGGTTEYLRGDGNWAVPAGGGGGAVSSVFTRTGAVVATTGDYTFPEISGTAAVNQGGTGAVTAAAAVANLGAVASGWCDMLGLGLLTAPPVESGFTVSVTAGNLVCCLVNCPKSITVSTLGVQVTAAGVTGSGTNAIALFTEAGVLIDQTGDMTTAFSSIGFMEGAMGSSHSLTAGTNYYLALLTHFSGTVPKVAATGTASTANIPLLNGHYIALFKSLQATVPGSFTPSSYTLNTGQYIMYAR